MNEATLLLRDKPLEFMKRYAMSPPSNAGYSTVPVPDWTPDSGRPQFQHQLNQTMTARRTLWNDPGDQVRIGEGTVVHQRVTKAGVQHAEVVDSPDAAKKGAKSFTLSAAPAANRVPMHFLPWGSEALIDMRLPEDKSDGTDPDNPNLFFTAALSGCSVFVDGHPARPRVVHAGIDGKLNVNARKFWEDRLVDLATQSGEPIDDHMRSIDKSMYGDTTMGWQYKQWLKNEYRDTLTIRSVREWASVFGIRYGRLWSFYLQRNAMVTTARAVKKDSLNITGQHDNLWYVHRDTGLNVTKETRTKGKGLFKRQKSVYLLQQTYNKPMAVQEIYPLSHGEGGVRIMSQNQHFVLT